MDNETHINPAVSALVMLAAIFTTYSTYNAYNDEKVALSYENDQVVLEQTASALASLRVMKTEALSASTTAPTEEDSSEEEAEVKIEYGL